MIDPGQLQLGTWRFSGSHFGKDQPKQYHGIINSALNDGINTFDTAQFYGDGMAEHRLYQALKHVKRDRYCLSSKAGIHWHENKVVHQADAKRLKKTLQKTLKTFHTDYLDIFYLHWKDPQISIAQSLHDLELLQKEGLCKYIGLCHLTATELQEALKTGISFYHQCVFNPIDNQDNELYQKIDQLKHIQNVIVSPFMQGLLLSNNQKVYGKKDWRRRHTYFNHKKLFVYKNKLNQRFKTNPEKINFLLTNLFKHFPNSKCCVGVSDISQYQDLRQIFL